MAACHLAATCKECKETFPSGNALSAHKRQVHEVRIPVTCEDCGVVVPDNHSLGSHRRRVHVTEEVNVN